MESNYLNKIFNSRVHRNQSNNSNNSINKNLYKNNITNNKKNKIIQLYKIDMAVNLQLMQE